MSRLVKIVVLALATALLAAVPAQAEFGLTGFSVKFEDKEGNAVTQPGAHPFAMTTNFDFKTKPGPVPGEVLPDGDPKSLRFEFPPGFAGSIAAVPRCSTADFLTVSTGEFPYPACSDATAIGVAWVQASHPGEPFTVPVYNLVPTPGVAAKIGFVAYPKIPITVDIGVDSKDPNNIVGNVVNVPQVVPLFGSSLEVWGIPADPAHDAYRGRCLKITPVHHYGELVSNGTNCRSTSAEVPFLTMPRSCTGPLVSSYEAISWQNPDAVPDKGSFAAPGMSGCSNLGFGPRVTAEPTSTSAQSASGLDFGIGIDDEGLTSPSGPATQSDVKDLTVKMPGGMTLNPSAANGLSACPRARYEAESLTTAPGQGCPPASKIGEVEVETPILPEGEILHGSVYLASQDDNPFGSLLALYVVIKDTELGVLIKRAGKVEPSEERGPNAGQIVTTFAEFPQTPFAHLHFRFNQGVRAPLVTPLTCGTYTTESQFNPWSDPASLFSTPATFNITSGIGGGPCPSGGVAPFAPGFSAGSINNAAGAYSAFNVHLTRNDSEQEFTRFSVKLPPGVTGKLAGIPFCPESGIAQAKAREHAGGGREEQANPSCPQASEVGTTLVGAGVGSVLTYVPGKVYLAGPYHGDPLSIVAITSGVVGPFDIGTVVIREALEVNPETAEVFVDSTGSDPIPHMIDGIPVRARDIRVYADRPNFTLNPTSCAQKETKATLFGSYLDVFNPADDVSVSPSDRYQAASCASLLFKPKLQLSLKGSTKRAGHPALRAVLTYPKQGAYANIARAQVNLPHSEFIDQGNLNKTCTRPVLLEGKCPAKSIYGRAKAWTPLLDEPLQGPVYLVGGYGYKLPALVAELNGEIRVVLKGKVDTGPNKGIRNTFEAVPDAPVEKFELSMKGGKKYSLLENSENLCAKPQRAVARFTGQNGKVDRYNPLIANDCGKKKRHTKSKGKN